MSDAATRVVVVRHGETDWNVEQRVQGQLDVPLNANGRRQAERLAAALADEGLAALYSSDLSRAADTAAAVARRAGLPVQHAPGLRERGFGHLEGMTWREIEQRHPEAALRWRRRDPAFGPGGGEVLADFYARCVAAAAALAARHAGQTIALVAHGGVLDCLYRAATRIALDAPRTWQLGNASINRLLATGEGFTLVGWNDTAHLEEAGRDESAAS
ncbi:MAG: histidine phosphatase family protein [Rubrivivax sp.]